MRHHGGPDILTRLGGNHAHDDAATRFGNAVKGEATPWVWQPVPPVDIAGCLEGKARQPIPVAGGEASFTRWGFREMIAGMATGFGFRTRAGLSPPVPRRHYVTTRDSPRRTTTHQPNRQEQRPWERHPGVAPDRDALA